ncbi:MAG: hypothetical protein LQ344_003555 [Seirophora lacunosa]|nr:MAG: hypothetical protein LQ344_003555 [Seirophora lacunosa]
MCREHRVDYACKHCKSVRWNFCEEGQKLPEHERLAMLRSGVLRCRKENGTTRESSVQSAPVGHVVAKIDQATKAVNRNLSSPIFPAAGCEMCYGATELAKLITYEKFAKWTKLHAIAQDGDGKISTKGEVEVAADSEHRIQSAKQMLQLTNTPNKTGAMLTCEPFAPVDVQMLLYERQTKDPSESAGEGVPSLGEAQGRDLA